MTKTVRSFRIGKVQAYLRFGLVSLLSRQWAAASATCRSGPRSRQANGFANQRATRRGRSGGVEFRADRDPDTSRQLAATPRTRSAFVRADDRSVPATRHLIRFLTKRPVRHASQFQAGHAEEFLRYLRTIHVSPNGHKNTAKRPPLDKGLRFILECCRALFGYAGKRRHLPPYADNPFRTLEIDRVPNETFRPIELFTPEQEMRFLNACDEWQFPLFLTLMLTGMRPGELSHLLLPDDLDLENGWLRIRNKLKLGWKVKTRNERDIPLVPELVQVLRHHLDGKNDCPIFLRRCFASNPARRMVGDRRHLENQLETCVDLARSPRAESFTGKERQRIALRFWLGLGYVPEDRIRMEFIRLTRKIGLPGHTAPKMFRHMFATTLQEGRVDPLIRNELMGHVATGERSAGHGLAMTAVYTHTRPETKRKQMEEAFATRAALQMAADRISRKVNTDRIGHKC